MSERKKPENNQYCTLSYELLYLLQWMVEHEYETLKVIASRALRSNARSRIREIASSHETHLNHEAQSSMYDFFALLETTLLAAMNEESVKHALEHHLLPVIDQIDINQCDEATVSISVAQTTSKLEQNPRADAQQVLFKELLKRWKPHKKAGSH